jgi:hypothetical protein
MRIAFMSRNILGYTTIFHGRHIFTAWSTLICCLRDEQLKISQWNNKEIPAVSFSEYLKRRDHVEKVSRNKDKIVSAPILKLHARLVSAGSSTVNEAQKKIKK